MTDSFDIRNSAFGISPTRRLAVMNLALRGNEADFGPEHADTFRNDLHPDLKADYILANFPFNVSDWFRKDDDVRWKYGLPPKGNANFGWIQHIIHHMAPDGMAGFVSANGAMSSNQSGDCNARSARREWATDSQGLGSQRDIRRALIEADREMPNDEFRPTNRACPTSTFENRSPKIAGIDALARRGEPTCGHHRGVTKNSKGEQ